MSAVEMRGRRLEPIVAEEIASQTRSILQAGGPRPCLATVLVGNDPAARSYRASIDRSFARVDVAHIEITLPEEISETEMVRTIDHLNDDPEITGVMLFLPLPGRRGEWAVRDHLSPLKDVDGVTPLSAGRLRLARPTLEPACPRAGVTLLQTYGVQLDGASVAVIGRSPVVGGPLALMLTAANATVTACHRHTRDLGDITRRSDVIASAAGQAGLVTGDMVSPGATVLDFGTNVVDGHLVGDAVFREVSEVAGAISPVPGGTGPATSLILAYQTMLAAHAVRAGTIDGIQLAPTVGQLVSRVATSS